MSFYLFLCQEEISCHDQPTIKKKKIPPDSKGRPAVNCNICISKSGSKEYYHLAENEDR